MLNLDAALTPELFRAWLEDKVSGSVNLVLLSNDSVCCPLARYLSEGAKTLILVSDFYRDATSPHARPLPIWAIKFVTLWDRVGSQTHGRPADALKVLDMVLTSSEESTADK